jgi:replicative DNA helicase
MPGTGKSAMAGMLLLGSLLEDRKLRAIWFRGEMSDRLLWSRFLATWSTLRSPAVDRITRKEASRRSKTARAVNADLANVVGDRLQIIGAPLTAERMAAAIKRHRPDVVVVDYLQRTSAAGFQDRRSELDHVLGVVSDLTTELDLATIVVSSMSKGTNGGADIGGLTKESNRLDFDAHNYLALWSDKKDRDRDPRPVRLEIAKGRTGGEGSLDLWFSGSAQSFTPQAADGYEDQAERCTDFDAYSVEAAR